MRDDVDVCDVVCTVVACMVRRFHSEHATLIAPFGSRTDTMTVSRRALVLSIPNAFVSSNVRDQTKTD